jgi:hypothetical protein|tara:strand:- start:810 stop:1388 length:579 start_codon:yes stop_codon:yes gene_type:complete
MNDILSMMEQDFEETSATALDKLDHNGTVTVASLARQISDKERVVAALEDDLKNEKKALLVLTDQDMPALMAEIGISSLTLDDGSVVKVSQTYGASILVANRDSAFQWLRENGYDDIIKNTVLCQFGRGDDEAALSFAHLAADNGYSPEQKTEVHSQTLRAFVKERVEKGDDFPMELFGAFVGQRATIKKGK